MAFSASCEGDVLLTGKMMFFNETLNPSMKVATETDKTNRLPKCAKSTFNKTESTLNKTYTGLTSMLQGFQIYFV